MNIFLETLELAHNKYTECDLKLKNFMHSFIIGSAVSGMNPEVIQNKIECYELQRDINLLYVKKVERFIRKMTDIQMKPSLKEINDEVCYTYFRDNLKPWEFDYPEIIEVCDKCHKAPTKKNGVAIMIMDKELINICASCLSKTYPFVA